MYLAQTNVEVDLDNVKDHVDGYKVLMIKKTVSQPELDWFVFKSDYESIGRECKVFRARFIEKENTYLVDFWYKEDRN